MSPVQTKREPRGRNRQRGAVILEATLILPLFLIFWFGIIDLGIAFFMRETVMHQVRAAARYAVVNNWDETKIKQVLRHNDPNSTRGDTPWFSLQAPTISVQLEGSPVNNDQRAVISISNYEWFHFTPFFAGRYVGRPITVTVPVEDLANGG
jgi:hypothetical protein